VPKIGFSDVKIRSLPLPIKGQLDYWDDKLPAFGLRVSQGGSKTFVLKLSNARITIGRFGVLSLAEARTEAKRRLAEKTLGKTRPASVTFPAAVRLFIEDKRKSCRASTADQYAWFLGRLNLTAHVADVTPDEISRALKRIKSRSTSDHVLIAARILFNWCIKRGYIEKNPTAALSPHASKGRSRVLSDRELKALWDICSDRTKELPTNYSVIVKLLMITGQRRGEIAALRTSFIDGTIVVLPHTLTKNSHEHVFPLPSRAAEILQNVEVDTGRNDAFFFSARGKTDRCFNGWSKAIKAVRKALGDGFPHFTLHDLRRTYRSNLGRLGVRPDIAERLVNHINARSDMEQVYDRYTYMPEMREAVNRYDEWFSALIS
jgi:integrase